MDIVCFSTTDWNEIWGSRQQIMNRLVNRGHRVLFIERQIGPEHLLRDPEMRRRKLNPRLPRFHWEKEGLWLFNPPTLLPGRYYSKSINRISQQFLALRVKRHCEYLKFHDPILWVYPPHSAPLIGHFFEQLVIYHCIDRFSAGQTGVKKSVIETEELELIQNADCIFVHSLQILELFNRLTSKPLHFIPSAADVKTFQSSTEIQPELLKIPSPRLGVVGTLDARIDIQLLIATVQAQPDWHLVLIGHTRPGIAKFEQLLQHPNVHWFGQQPYSTLPGWLNGMDIFLVPYKMNDLTQYVHPLKIYEYMAIGKPIVSTDLPEIRFLESWINITRNNGAFINTIKRALNEVTPSQIDERRRIAQKHDWDQRLELMWNIIQDTICHHAS